MSQIMPKDHLADLQDQRFTLIDAIRGLAAVAVMERHIFYNRAVGERLEGLLPLPIQVLSIWGAAGVYAFFIISGFVIAHSLRSNSLSRAGIGSFALRRQIRLDLPYWAMIALYLLLSLPHFDILKEIGAKGILLNLFYLQYLSNVNTIVPVAWTLCIEAQFYVVFVALLWLCKRSEKNARFNAPRAATAAIFVSGVCALVLVHFNFYGALFLGYWHYFALGVIIYWALRGAIATHWAWLYVALFALSTGFSDWHGINSFGTSHSLSFTGMAVGLGTALILWWAATKNSLTSWGNHPILQYLGRISYSLYLIHPMVVQAAHRINFYAPHTDALALAYWFLTPLISVGCAHLLHRFVERPSLALAARVRGASRAALISSAP